MKIIYNGDITDSCKINACCNGFTYGEGFFTTIKIQNNKGENLKYHYKRIKESLTYFKFPQIELDIESIIKKLDFLTESNFRLKIIIFKDIDKISYIAIPGGLPEQIKHMNLSTSEYIRGNDPIFSYKSLNYYTNLINSKTVILDHKQRVLETGIGNIFIIMNNEIITPPGNLPLLKGTYRNFLLDKKRIENFYIIERDIYIEDLFKCEGVFITNALRGIVPIQQIDNKTIEIRKVLEFSNLLNS